MKNAFKVRDLEVSGLPGSLIWKCSLMFSVYHPAVKQVDDAVGVVWHRGRVRYHHDGSALIQLRQQFHYFFTVGRIQVTGRFIRQDHFGFGHNGAGK